MAFATLVVAGGSARPAHAQGKNKKGEDQTTCQVDDRGAVELTSAQLFLQKATDPKTDTTDRTKALKQAIGALTPNEGRIKNEVGQAYMLGEALALWAAQPGAPLSGPRRTFGFREKPDEPIDVLAFTDSLFTRVQKDKPDCATYLGQLRQQPYVPLVNAAIQALNAGKIDSAEALAKQSLEIYRKSPYAYNVLAGVAVRRNDYTAAAKNYQTVLDLSATDTSLARLKSAAFYNLAVVTQSEAEAAKGSDKKALQDSSLVLWRAYAAANPADANGKAGLAHALQVGGDTLSAAALTSDMAANPTKYTDVQVFQAAISAAHDNRQAEALRLFKAGLTINPYFRDALAYVGGAYGTAGQADSLFPVARRLLEVDPSNPDTYQLIAYAFQMRLHADKDPTAKKADQDTLLYYFTKFKNAPVKVTVTKFSHDGDKLTLGGTVQNLTDTPKTWPIKFEFLDKTGKVIATQDVPPLTVDPKGSKDFTVTVQQAGIAAFKYEPLQ
jgi:Flp pilus assembly protein TadD